MHHALHRLLAGSAAALLAAAAIALPGAPALAAGTAVHLYFPDTTVAGSLAKDNALFAWIDVPGRPGEVAAPAAEITVTVETAGVADIATVTALDEFEIGEGQSCARTGTVIKCVLAGPFDLEPGINLVPLLVLQVTGKAGAAEDARGELAFSARLDDAAAVTTKATVTIGEGVDLAGIAGPLGTVAAGASVEAALRVANRGTTPVRSAVLVLAGWDPSLLPGPGFRNCRYGILIVCTFDDVLATGTTYELATPMRLKIPADATGGSRASALGGWYTPGDFKELTDIAPELDDDSFGPKGTGPATRLRKVPAEKADARAAAGQVDTDPKNNFMISEVVVGGRRPDLAAIGATVAGHPGDKVDARVGFRNDGPGTLYPGTFDNTDPGTRVAVPAGVRAVAVDERCFPLAFEEGEEPDDYSEAQTGASDYYCMLSEGTTKAKASVLFDFTFQVRDDPSAAAGEVAINEDSITAGTPLDRNSGNDSAKIAVAFDGDGDGGAGGGLPVTGAGAGLVAAGGAVLLLAGAAGLLLVRRRRLRFTA